MATAKKVTLPRLVMKDMTKIFPVSHITIINWKNPKEGVEHRKDPLPHRKDSETGRVDYNARDVKRWADKNEVPYKVDPVAYAEKLAAKQAGKTAAAPKPGPKPAAKKRAAKAGPKKTLKLPAKKATQPARKRSKPIKKALLKASESIQQKEHAAPAQAEQKPEAKASRRA